MNRSLVCIRFVVFFLLVVCFAVQASVAAWDLQNQQSLHLHAQLDAFLIFCGICGLLAIFPVAYIDLLRRKSIFVRVWFEVLWLGVFFVFEIAAAAALTVVVPGLACNGTRNLSCQSTRVLTGFTWTITFIVVVYFSTLMICSILHHDAHPHVWHTSVRDFPWFEGTTKRMAFHGNAPMSWVPEDQSLCTRKLTTPSAKEFQPPTVEVMPPIRPVNEIQHLKRPTPSLQGMPKRIAKQAVLQSSPYSLYPRHLASINEPTIPSGTFTISSYPRPAGSWPNHTPSSSISSSDSIEAASPRRKARRARPPPLDLSKVSVYRR